MTPRAVSALVLGLLIGCSAPQSSLMDVRDMSDENLVEYYLQIEDDIIATQKELEQQSKSSRVIPSAIKQDKLNNLKKRKYRVEGEFTRRRLALPKVETPDGEGRY